MLVFSCFITAVTKPRFSRNRVVNVFSDRLQKCAEGIVSSWRQYETQTTVQPINLQKSNTFTQL